jgi:DNA-binding NarL/FixJ family response regulator
MERSSVRVIVVDDYEPFRRFICSTLEKNPELQIVGQASDGLEAVQKAEELQSDLILLDIGLPTLNGIEAARRIRKTSPECKILFVSQESSADVVQEALNLGARGYVVKTRAGSDLLAAVEAVLQGCATQKPIAADKRPEHRPEHRPELQIIVRQPSPVSVGFEPVVKVNLIQIGGDSLLTQLMCFRAHERHPNPPAPR